VDDGSTADYRHNALGQRVYKRRVTGGTPDYAVLAAEADQQANDLQADADTLEAQAMAALAAADEARLEAAAADDERQAADALAAEYGVTAAEHRTSADRLQRQADRYRFYLERGPVAPRIRFRLERNIRSREAQAEQAIAAAEAAEASAENARLTADSAAERQAEAEARAQAQDMLAADLQQEAEDKRRVAVEQRDQADEYRRLAGESPEDNAVESRFVYGPNGRLIGEYDAQGNTVRETVRLGTTPVASLDAESRLHYLHTDHLGTPREAARPGGEVVWRWTSSPFGVATPNADVDGDGQAFTLNLRFPGQYFDEETGTHYNYFRDYDPGVGRYVQSDPIGLLGGVNTYVYAEASPIMYFDPLGLWAWGINFGGSVTIPFTQIHVGGSFAFVADQNGTSGILYTFETGVGTPGGGVFGRGLLATGNNTTIDSLEGWGDSGSISVGRFSGSISTSFLTDCEGNITGEAIPPVIELGFGFGTVRQGALTGTYSGVWGRNTYLGDFGRWLGRTLYDMNH
jgi:RHS repeat-associated protein